MELIGYLANFGVAAIVLGWFLIRIEPRLEKVERAINTFSAVMLAEVLSRNHLSHDSRLRVEQLKKDVEAGNEHK